MTARYVVGDVFDTLATLEPDSVDLVLTSPPFLALRSYLPAGHPDKSKEIGSEATPADFIDTLLDVVEACDRVLAPHGSICVELGDSYSGGSAEGTDARNEDRGEWTKYRGRSNGCDITKTGAGWPLDKSLTGIPQLFMLSLAYGRNMLQPERTTPRWRVRNVVAWVRPNPPVGALGDKYRPATSYLTVACKSRGPLLRPRRRPRTQRQPHRRRSTPNTGTRQRPRQRRQPRPARTVHSRDASGGCAAVGLVADTHPTLPRRPLRHLAPTTMRHPHQIHVPPKGVHSVRAAIPADRRHRRRAGPSAERTESKRSRSLSARRTVTAASRSLTMPPV